ncbi:MAG: hypothetical protein GYB31_21060 [Bacteroidetes bacterium]|nr:hypothetical protein [Bacteroidota bacterium]
MLIRIVTILLLFSVLSPLKANNGDPPGGLTYSAYEGSSLFDFDPVFYLEAFIGGTASFVHGEYATYQKSFHAVFEEGTDFTGSLTPLFFGTAGIKLRFVPFEDNVMENFSLSFGMQYLQGGFTNKYRAVHESDQNFTDITDFQETYRHHYLAFPLEFRWGTKFYGSIGVNFCAHLTSGKSHVLEREQSGDGALDGGFTLTDEAEYQFDPLLMGNPSAFILAFGYQFNEGTSIELKSNFFKDLAHEVFPRDYRIILLELNLKKSFEL